MKNYLILFYFCAALLFAGCEAEYVATTPDDEVVVRTDPPFVGAVWIDNEWRWDHHRYVREPAHWDHPRGTWQRGSWQKASKGYKWQHGRWH